MLNVCSSLPPRQSLTVAFTVYVPEFAQVWVAAKVQFSLYPIFGDIQAPAIPVPSPHDTDHERLSPSASVTPQLNKTDWPAITFLGIAGKSLITGGLFTVVLPSTLTLILVFAESPPISVTVNVGTYRPVSE